MIRIGLLRIWCRYHLPHWQVLVKWCWPLVLKIPKYCVRIDDISFLPLLKKVKGGWRKVTFWLFSTKSKLFTYRFNLSFILNLNNSTEKLSTLLKYTTKLENVMQSIWCFRGTAKPFLNLYRLANLKNIFRWLRVRLVDTG